MRRPLKFPVSALVGAACGHRSEAYRKAYALEQWAARHGYSGHRPHNVPELSEIRDRKQRHELFAELTATVNAATAEG